MEARRFRPPTDPIDGRELLDRITQVEVFERFLQRTFPGKTRFSIEGLDLMIPVLDEIIADAIVVAGSDADGATLASLAFHTTTGMEVLAIERTDRWIYRPVRSQALRADDRLLVLGPHEGLMALRDRCGDVRPVEETSLRSESDEDE